MPPRHYRIGVLGLKPTLGRIPHDLVPEGFASFIHLGAITRNVSDMARLLKAMAGPTPSDPHSLGDAADRYIADRRAQAGNLAGKRIGLIMRAKRNARQSARR